MPTLPNKILSFHNHFFVRIYRVIGGLCLILWLSKLYENLNINLIYILPIAMIHLIYIIIINLIKIKSIIYLWRSGKFNISLVIKFYSKKRPPRVRG
jgi:hypothetical protein